MSSMNNVYLASATSAMNDIRHMSEKRATAFDIVHIEYDDNIPPHRAAILGHAAENLAKIFDAEEVPAVQ